MKNVLCLAVLGASMMLSTAGCFENTAMLKEKYKIAVVVEPRFERKGIKRVAVIGFENRSSDKNAGEILADAFEARLVSFKDYEVITRRELKKLLDEKNIALSGIVKAEDAKRIGTVLSVDAIVSGVITTYKIEHERKPSLQFRGYTKLKKNATTVLNVKLIETANGRVLYAHEGVGNWWESGHEGVTNYSADELILKRARDQAIWDCLKGMVTYAQMREMTGYRTRIGVRIKSPNKRVRVVEVMADSPAEKAGVKSGDVITKVDGMPVTATYQLVIAVRNTPPGKPLLLELERDGHPLKLKVIAGRMPK